MPPVQGAWYMPPVQGAWCTPTIAGSLVYTYHRGEPGIYPPYAGSLVYTHHMPLYCTTLGTPPTSRTTGYTASPGTQREERGALGSEKRGGHGWEAFLLLRVLRV